MTKPTTPYQRGIIKRYYKNKDDIMAQKLSEIVSELYLCSDGKKKERLWKSAHTTLKNLEIPPKKAESCIAQKDIEKLAEIMNELF